MADFGGGSGAEAVEMVQHGVARVLGIDIIERSLETARRSAQAAGVADGCHFTSRADQRVDVVVSLDGFEHFGEPEDVLRSMSQMIRRGGRVLLTFGPTWLHPLGGGHLFSVFPLAHLVFTEHALIRWHSGFKSDGATRFSEVEGGLNQMTIRRFRRLVSASPLSFETFKTVPIRRLWTLANPLMREFVTSFVRSRLRPRGVS
jgi:SAM-dependent methyltransferase